MLRPAETLDVDRQQHVVEDGAPGKEHRRLEDDPDVAARAGDGQAAEPHFATRRGKQSGDDLEQGGLAAARRPDDRNQLALGHVQVDVLERQDGAALGRVLLAESLHGDQGVGRVRHSSPWTFSFPTLG